MNGDAGYALIACGVHDRLEHWAVRGDTVEVVWRDGAAERRATTTIADVTARGGADWVRLGTGDEVRADRLVRVGDVLVTPACEVRPERAAGSGEISGLQTTPPPSTLRD